MVFNDPPVNPWRRYEAFERHDGEHYNSRGGETAGKAWYRRALLIAEAWGRPALSPVLVGTWSPVSHREYDRSVSMFPQLVAQRLVALRLRRKRLGKELTVQWNRRFFISFLSTTLSFSFSLSRRSPMKSQFQACVCHFELAAGPLELNWLDDWCTVLCTVSISKHRSTWQSSTFQSSPLASFVQRFHLKTMTVRSYDSSNVWQIFTRLLTLSRHFYRELLRPRGYWFFWLNISPTLQRSSFYQILSFISVVTSLNLKLIN